MSNYSGPGARMVDAAQLVEVGKAMRVVRLRHFFLERTDCSALPEGEVQEGVSGLVDCGD